MMGTLGDIMLMLLAWSSLGLPQLTSLGPSDWAGSDQSLELWGEGNSLLPALWQGAPPQLGVGVLTLGSQGRKRQKQPWLQTWAVALLSVRLFTPVSR